MTVDEIVADPLTFRVGYNSTVKVTVYRDGLPFDEENFPGAGFEQARYSVVLRGLVPGAATYAVTAPLPKVAGAVAQGAVPAWPAALEGKTLVFWPVLVDADADPAGDTLTGDFEEVLGEFRRTIRAAKASA